MRRQFWPAVENLCPASCLPDATSHSRNSAPTLPLPSLTIRPTTRASACIERQSGNRGAALTSRTCSRKEARSRGRNSPERSRSAWTTFETSPASCASSPRNTGMAIGIGVIVPSVCVPWSCAKAGVTRFGPNHKLTTARAATASAFLRRSLSVMTGAPCVPSMIRCS